MRDLVDIVKSPEPTEMPRPWTIVSRADAVVYDRGVAALVDGKPVAVFRLPGINGADEWYAVSHVDPVNGVPVMARGLVGSYGEDLDVPTVASPLHKRRYDLRSGACLDDETPALETFDVRVIDDWVLVA